MRQTAAHQLIGLLSEAAQKPGGTRSEAQEGDYISFNGKKRPEKRRVYHIGKLTGINNYDKKQTAQKITELSEKKNQNYDQD